MAGTIELLTTPNSFLASPLVAMFGTLDPLLLAQAESASLPTVIVTQLWLWARVAIGIGLVIFVHELGHFLAAKWCGVKVEKFYVGFDVPIRIGPIRFPRTLGKFRYGETEYGLGTIPLGGYVKMLGQDDDPREMEKESKRIRQSDGEADTEGAEDHADNDAPVKLDPRSFPAKTVWQRMLIISSGVIMNLITGVLFAAAAFMYGVPYLPAVVGDVTPGGPAYQAGIEPGGKVVGVGGISQDDQLYFTDMATAIMIEGTSNPDQPVNVAIEYPDGVRNYELTTAAVASIPGLRRIGISNISTTILPSNPNSLASSGSVAEAVLTDADAGAEVVSIDGEPIIGAGNADNVAGSVMLQRAIMARVGHPITLGLRRPDGSNAEVTLPPQPLVMPGVGLAPGPVTALVAGGPAEQAGVRVGDRLVAVNGDSEIDAFSLPSRLADVDEPIKLTLIRSQGTDGQTATDAQTIEIELTPTAPVRTSTPVNQLDNIVALDRLGLAYKTTTTVAFVRPDAADSTDLKPGDVLKKIAVRWPGGETPSMLAKPAASELKTKLETGWEFSTEYPFAALFELWQHFPAETSLKVTVLRDNKIVDVDANLIATDQFWHDRGLRFVELQRTHVASSFGQAMGLGLAASQRKLTEVFRFLGLLVTGKAGANMVGGPITIFKVAGQETNRGIPALLMFLTLLSMNLAILNFLPIPALDGGHMLFLTTEAVLGRPVNEKLQMQLTMAGVLALLSLMAFAIFNDIRRL